MKNNIAKENNCVLLKKREINVFRYSFFGTMPKLNRLLDSPFLSDQSEICNTCWFWIEL